MKTFALLTPALSMSLLVLSTAASAQTKADPDAGPEPSLEARAKAADRLLHETAKEELINCVDGNGDACQQLLSTLLPARVALPMEIVDELVERRQFHDEASKALAALAHTRLSREEAEKVCHLIADKGPIEGWSFGDEVQGICAQCAEITREMSGIVDCTRGTLALKEALHGARGGGARKVDGAAGGFLFPEGAEHLREACQTGDRVACADLAARMLPPGTPAPAHELDALTEHRVAYDDLSEPLAELATRFLTPREADKRCEALAEHNELEAFTYGSDVQDLCRRCAEVTREAEGLRACTGAALALLDIFDWM